MARAGTSMTADAIRIEDEVWQEAFETRVPSRPRRSTGVAVAPVAHLRPVPAEAPSPSPEDVAAVSPDPGPREPEVSAGPAPERRTIRIQGRGAERNLPWPGERSRRRPPRTLHERAGLRPDRVAMWAMFLGLLLVFVAAVSAHG